MDLGQRGDGRGRLGGVEGRENCRDILNERVFFLILNLKKHYRKTAAKGEGFRH